MGMFDTVRVEQALPDGLNHECEWLQTKATDCTLDTYTITRDGRLLGPDGATIKWHGWFNFYTLSKAGKWHEYQAKFTDGALQYILTADRYCEEVHGAC